MTGGGTPRVICEEIRTGRQPRDESALPFRIRWGHRAREVDGVSTVGHGNGAWRVEIWVSQWVTLALIPTDWRITPAAQYGQEIYARNGDVNTVIAPTNFGHKANVKTELFLNGPWHDDFLDRTHMSDRSATRTDRPFSVTDLRSGDFTSIVTCVPVQRKCE